MKTYNSNINGESLTYFDSKKGETTLLFIHGAFINKEYWKEELSYFSPIYRVIALDLAGHGSSSQNRIEWTVQSFGKDVAAFIKKLSLKSVILIGHSFGSDVMLEAVTLDEAAIIGLIEVDHMKNVGMELPKKTVEQLVKSLNTDFATTCEQYAKQALLTDATNPKIVSRLLKNYKEMSPEVGVPLLENSFGYPSREKQLLTKLKLKLNLIHVDYTPTNENSLKKSLGDNYKLHKIEGTCHYPMLEHPKIFNKILEKIIAEIGQN
ncbi:alpha/beta hydrolase [Aquimarina gracilis]|uniref:Alpha/beta hydrolase n=1 Tax=Aquimarina gracilis TaxID=874422 RepID=A0ABU5ZVI0_9FLAO|nr:alpha/beta hydrolase [Aquimarina gracilis]MEB3345842.1 alpha/beta hydrolase [Aquimarina gracilis]